MDNAVRQLAELVASMKVVDLSPTLERGIPRWPTHPHLVIDPTVVHEHDGYYCQSISMAEHTGAHVDAPSHSHAHLMDRTIDRVAPDHFIAPAVVYDFSDRQLAPGDLLTAADFLEQERVMGDAVGAKEIALVNFGWYRRYWRTDAQAQWYATNAPGLDRSAVQLLAERKVKAVGTDTIAAETPIKDGVPGPAPGHMELWLPQNILIIESLCYLELLPVRCFFVALPLRIKNGSGSPVRPVALIP